METTGSAMNVARGTGGDDGRGPRGGAIEEGDKNAAWHRVLRDSRQRELEIQLLRFLSPLHDEAEAR